MQRLNRLKQFIALNLCLVMCSGLLAGPQSDATKTDVTSTAKFSNEDKLGTIRQVLTTFCDNYERKGGMTQETIRAKGKLEGSMLFKLLVDTGVKVKYEDTEIAYNNVLQKDLAGELKSTRECKVMLWQDLKPIVLRLLNASIRVNNVSLSQLLSALGEPASIESTGKNKKIYTFVRKARGDFRAIFKPYRCVASFVVEKEWVTSSEIVLREEPPFFKNSIKPCKDFDRLKEKWNV